MTALWLAVVLLALLTLAVLSARVLRRPRTTRPYPPTTAHLVHHHGEHWAQCFDGWEGRAWPTEADAYADAIWHDLETHADTSQLDRWDGADRVWDRIQDQINDEDKT